MRRPLRVHTDVVELVSGQWIVKRGENSGYEILNVDEIPLERTTAPSRSKGTVPSAWQRLATIVIRE
jgi:hypothetical protein